METFAISVNNIEDIECGQIGSISLSGVGGIPPYTYSWSPSNVTNSQIVVNSPGQQNVVVEDMQGCVTSTSFLMNGPTSQNQYDLISNLITTNFRPGFSTNIWLDAFNSGCQNQSGQLKLISGNNVSFNYGWPTPSFANQDTIIWNFYDLNFDSLHITPYINVTTDITAVIGDSVHFTLEITPISNDFDPTNNNRNYVFPVVNGYDPNDKKVYPIGLCSPGYVTNDQTLTYTVRFQNTGNSEAINVSVIDSLNSNIDINSLRILGASHELYTEIRDSNVVKFIFNNINLPDSSSNEIESHGYVIFSVNLKQNLQHNTEISNDVGIYFDFNPVVLTNEVKNTIFIGDLNNLECYLEVEKIEINPFLMYPNPTSESFTIKILDFISDSKIAIFDLNGRNVYTKKLQNKTSTIDVSNFQKGFYTVVVENDNYTPMRKVLVIN